MAKTNLVCHSCGAKVEPGQDHNFQRILQESGFRPIFPEAGLRWLCPKCGQKAEEHAVELLTMLKGVSVQIWQLVPEQRRLKIMGADVAADT